MKNLIIILSLVVFVIVGCSGTGTIKIMNTDDVLDLTGIYLKESYSDSWGSNELTSDLTNGSEIEFTIDLGTDIGFPSADFDVKIEDNDPWAPDWSTILEDITVDKDATVVLEYDGASLEYQ